MPTTCPLPDAAKIRSMLELVFEGLDAKPGKKFEITPASGGWVGLYVTDDGKPVAACAADSSLAAHAGAALTMLPPTVAKDAIKTLTLSDAMVANLHEIMNICSRLLMTDNSVHVRLAELYPAAAMPATLTSVIGAAQGRVDCEVQVPKYGTGILAFITT